MEASGAIELCTSHLPLEALEEILLEALPV